MNAKVMGTRLKLIYDLGNVIIRNPSVLVRKYRYLFVFSHMRGYTSLLCHILGSHPEISGYFELQKRYRWLLDLIMMRIRIAKGVNYQVRGQYLLDKILHSRLFISPQILEREDVFTIFMLRRPETSLRSLMALRQKINYPEDVPTYYIERLKSLQKISYVPSNRIFLDGELLVENPEPVLEFIRSYLQLEQDILSSYSIFKFTGKGGYGDRSNFIMQGKIVKQRNSNEKIQVSRETLDRASKIYQETREVLVENCLNI